MNEIKINKKVEQTTNNEPKKGKGIDIGTAFVKCAREQKGKIIFRSERNAFFEVEHNEFTKKILDNSKVRYIIKDDKLYVVGNEALEFANMFNKETRRPLSKGVISPSEKEALPIVEMLIKNVIGEPSNNGEIAYFSVPGEPVDASFDIIYHEKILEGFLKTLGYTPRSINEAHAVILSELADEDFTGFGISFGGGMVNVCLSFMSVPVFKFSVTKAGDWIDQQVAMVVDETASRIASIKETSLDLGKENNLNKIESALSVYYDHLIEYVIQNIRHKFDETSRLPQIQKPLNIAISGGTSLPKGFSDRFERHIKQIPLPIPIGNIRMSSQPLRSVAKGALVAANVNAN